MRKFEGEGIIPMRPRSANGTVECPRCGRLVWFYICEQTNEAYLPDHIKKNGGSLLCGLKCVLLSDILAWKIACVQDALKETPHVD